MLIDLGSHQQQKEPVLVLEGPEEGAMDSSLYPPHSLPSTGKILGQVEYEIGKGGEFHLIRCILRRSVEVMLLSRLVIRGSNWG